ncbi:DUF4177 domain-containing protein [Halococcus sp. IIIV-5B]|uniref:DUF4177 domain-containing protein n=1 Tax=Halococcus sp. IIIV-5B TaxID=2321230 RepID=UPI000E752709|nr:DUF4177 domain-containing protein [Halococcus sp. IIIV-5B]RJT07024.1 DUF4177 domain-containing protein [Halococcus sp. IIIV-5B]
MTKWEYRIVDLDEGGFLRKGEELSEDMLNEWGDEEWELVTELPGSKTGLSGRPVTVANALVFKRPKK